MYFLAARHSYHWITCAGSHINQEKENKALIIRKYDYVIMCKSVMSSKHFHVLLSCNDVLRSMEMCRFAIRMSLIIHFHSAIGICVDGMCLGKGWQSRARCVTHSPQAIDSKRALTFSCPRWFPAIYKDRMCVGSRCCNGSTKSIGVLGYSYRLLPKANHVSPPPLLDPWMLGYAPTFNSLRLQHYAVSLIH
jgi:hypothetical protein